MRHTVIFAALMLSLVACTKPGPPPPDLRATEESIRAELAAFMTTEAPTASPTATGTPVPEPTANPTATHTATVSPTATPTATFTPIPTPTPTATPITYTVQVGDHLTKIARQFGVTVETLAAANGIENPSLIQVGQVLVIPPAEAWGHE